MIKQPFITPVLISTIHSFSLLSFPFSYYSIDELKRSNDRHVQRQKQVDKDLAQTSKELRAFQTEKQLALNQLDMVVPLTIKQILCLDYESVPEGSLPTRLVTDATINTHVLMNQKDLQRLHARTKELEDETRAGKHAFKVRYPPLAKRERVVSSKGTHIIWGKRI